MYEAESSDEQAQTRGFNRTSFAADGYTRGRRKENQEATY